jgi:hypothetical protein
MLRSKILAAAVSGLTLVALAATDAAAAPAGVTGGAPSIGVRFFPDGNGQCAVRSQPPGSPAPVEQWAESPNWTAPIWLDTDNRAGGCEIGFGLQDPGHVLSGLTLKYKWQVSPFGDANQCGDRDPANTALGVEHEIRPAPFPVFGPNIRIDTDGRMGWCDLTFTIAGRDDVTLDVEYSQDINNGQCKGWLPSGSFHRVSIFTPPVTIGDDTDNRNGGCTLRFRLMTF